MKNTQEISRRLNSMGELSTIELLKEGKFAGNHLLILHDNLKTGREAMTLLDSGMIGWLISELSRIQNETTPADKPRLQG